MKSFYQWVHFDPLLSSVAEILFLLPYGKKQRKPKSPSSIQYYKIERIFFLEQNNFQLLYPSKYHIPQIWEHQNWITDIYSRNHKYAQTFQPLVLWSAWFLSECWWWKWWLILKIKSNIPGTPILVENKKNHCLSKSFS